MKRISSHPTTAEIADLYANLTARVSPDELTDLGREFAPLLRGHIRMGKHVFPDISATEVVMAIFPRLEIVQSVSQPEAGTLLLLLLWLATQLPPEELAPSEPIEVTQSELAIWQSIRSQAS